MSMLETSLSLGGILRFDKWIKHHEKDIGDDGVGRGGLLPAQETAPTRQPILSTCHNSPKIIFQSGASLLTVKRLPKKKDTDADEVIKKDKPTKRGNVSGFSAKSRLRLMRTLASVRRDNLPLFVTLTFPENYPNIQKAKTFLDSFIKRLARKFPNVAGVWKLEPQKRGAPHFHLLVWGASYIDMVCFVPTAWYEIVGSNDVNHLAWHRGELGHGNKLCVQQIEKQKGVFWYASKYMSKIVSEKYADWGRWWGVFFRKRLPVGEIINVEVTEKKAVEFIRYMRRFAHVKSRDYKSLTIICNPDIWINKLL